MTLFCLQKQNWLQYGSTLRTDEGLRSGLMKAFQYHLQTFLCTALEAEQRLQYIPFHCKHSSTLGAIFVVLAWSINHTEHPAANVFIFKATFPAWLLAFAFRSLSHTFPSTQPLVFMLGTDRHVTAEQPQWFQPRAPPALHVSWAP